MEKRPRKDLRWQFALPVLGFMLGVGVVGTVLISHFVRRDLYAALEGHGEFAAHSMQYAAETASNVGQIRRYIAAVGAEESIVFAVVVAGAPPAVIASTELARVGQGLEALPPPIRKSLRRVITTHASEWFPRQQAHLDFVHPVLIGNLMGTAGEPLGSGVLLLRMSTERVEATIDYRVREFTLIFSAVLIGITAVVLTLVGRLVVIPQRELLAAATARQRGEKVAASIQANNEFGVLGEAFNEMLRRTDEHADALLAINHKLAEQASVDSLTGIANRRHLDEYLEAENRRAARFDRSLSFLLIDIDEFKAYNDNYGHVAGDEVLVEVARILRQVFVRTSDLPARYGGEEFAVVLPDTGRDAAHRLAERLREALAVRGIPHAYSRVAPRLTVSIGLVSTVPLPGLQAESLIRAADSALYAAKRSGRDQVVAHEAPVEL